MYFNKALSLEIAELLLPIVGHTFLRDIFEWLSSVVDC